MRAMNWLTKKVIKMRLEGPFNIQMEQKILHQLAKITPSNSQSLALIINSYGGSPRVAKNIAIALKKLQSKKVPVYCFAEEFCLNSANIILTASTQCFANKLSIIGDFGLEKVSSHSVPIDTIGNHYQLKDSNLINKLLEESADELGRLVFQNRSQKIQARGISPSTFEEKVLTGGSLVPSDAVKLGLIDSLENCEHFISTNLSEVRVEDKENKQYRAINFLRDSLEIFKQE